MKVELLVALVVVLVVTGLFFALLKTILCVIGAMGRGVSRLVAGGPAPDSKRAAAGQSARGVPADRTCTNDRCRSTRHPPGARYCTRCGTALSSRPPGTGNVSRI